MTRKLLKLVLTLTVAACATATDTADDRAEKLASSLADKGYEMLAPVDRISNYRINGWIYVDEYNTIFEAGVSDYYLLTFDQRCMGLRTAFTIAFSRTTGRLTRFDKVLVRDQAGGLLETCNINAIHRVRKTPKDS